MSVSACVDICLNVHIYCVFVHLHMSVSDNVCMFSFYRYISVVCQIVTLQCLRQLVPWLASAQRLAQARGQAEPLAFFTQATERIAQVVATSLNCR